MKKTEVNKFLKSKSFEKFKILGFKRNQYGIVKKLENYEFYVAFGIVDSDNSFPTSFHYGISSRYLNNILLHIFPEKGFIKNNYVGIYGEKQTQLFDNGEFPILEYDIRIEEDIDIMMQDLYDYIEKVLPFLEKLMNIQTLSKFINSDKVLNESMYLPTTLKNGLIYAKLANDNNYNELEYKYRELVENWADWNKVELQKTINFLNNHSQDELIRIAEGKN